MRSLKEGFVWVASILSLLFCAMGANARVTRVEIISRSDIQDGRSFGLAGAYEKIVGRVYFAVDPANIHNRQIVDLDKAPRNAQGEVEFYADLYLLRPKDMDKGNGAVLFEVSNRGGKGILHIVNGVTSSDPKAEFGDGFLMRQGYTVAWVGWEADLAETGDRLRLFAPVAHDPGGKTIRGLVRSDYTPAQKLEDMPLGHFLLGPTGGKSYPVDDPASSKNILTVRDTPNGLRKIIPRSQWSFAHTVDDKIVADPHYIHLDAGFQPGKIYEVVYEAKDPVVVGLGLASVRDFLSYLKYDPHSTAPIHRVYAVGISQSGRFLRHFLYQDFNADEQGRQVMDGVIAHVAGAGRGSFNHRFAQPSRDAQPLSSIFFPNRFVPLHRPPRIRSGDGRDRGSSRRRKQIAYRAKGVLHQHFVRILGPLRLSDSYLWRRIERRQARRECPRLHARWLAAFFRAISSEKEQSQLAGFERAAALQSESHPVVLARADHGHGPMGERRHPASVQHLSENCRCHPRAPGQMEFPQNSRGQQAPRSEPGIPS